MMAERVLGIWNGADCDGIEGGSGGSLMGAGSVRRGASRRGSTCLR